MFSLAQILNGRTGQPETLRLNAVAGESFTLGEALVFNGSGKLTKATGDVSVEFISMENFDAPALGIPTLSVYKVCDGMIFYTTGKNGTSHIGKHFTIADDGGSVTTTAATEGFGAEIVSVEGSKLRVLLK